MADKLNITELDYTQIKENLISYFQNVTDQNGNLVYQDYDFAGSALNTLMGILAYNTHYNAMLAHMAVNESFIDSAQLRSSVVSSAKLLGYVPRSASSSNVLVDLSVACKEPSSSQPATIFLDKGLVFSNSWNGKIYYYVLPDGVTLNKNNEGNRYVSATGGVRLAEGQIVTKRFQVNGSDDYEKYIIDDENIDTNSLIVKVYQNPNDLASVQLYTLYSDISQADPNSQLYYLNENTLGRYEITFGNGIISKKLSPLNVIELEYVITNGSGANGSPGPFTLASSNTQLQNYTVGSVSITPKSVTSSGSDRESIENIRTNATSTFVTQDRAVTADDYISIITRNFSGAESVSVWGGEDNVPPQYGKVFISVKKQSDSVSEVQLNDLDKRQINNILRSKKVLSIIPEIIDVEYINIVLDVLYKYNSNILGSSHSSLEDDIRNVVIKEYNDKYLSGFGEIFRHSHFTKTVDNYVPAILNSHVRVYLSKTFDINPDSYTDLIVKYGSQLTVDDDKSIAGYITDTTWLFNEERVYLADKQHPTDQNIRILYTYQLLPDGKTQSVLLDNVGTLTLSTGILKLTQRAISSAPFKLTLDLIPISDDIVSRRNQLINIDYSRCNVQGYVDEIAVGGISRSINYQTFKRDR